MHRLPARRTAFTMIELVIVIVVLGLLAGVGVIAYTSAVTTSQDRAASLALTDVAREAAALAAQNGETEWSEDDWTTALADTAAGPALAGSGVAAAGKLALVNTAADSTNSSSMSFGQVSLQTRTGGVAGLAMKSQAGHCVFVRAVLPQQITAWKSGTDLGGNCLASAGLDGGPAGTYTHSDTVVAGATPLAPTGLTAALSGSTAALSWSAVTGATAGYTVYRSTDGGSTWTKLAGPQPAATYADPTVTAGGTFTYAVTASATNESPKSASAAVTLIPAAPAGVSASASGTQVTVSWTAPAGSVSFNVYRDGAATPAVSGVTGTSWKDTSFAQDGSTHSYAVSAVNAAGESARSAAASATVMPAAVSSVTVTRAPNTANYTISWPASTGATQYVVTTSLPGTTAQVAAGTGYTFTMPTGSTVSWTASVAAANPAGTATATVSGTVSPPVNYEAAVLADGPLAFYKLTEGSGGAAVAPGTAAANSAPFAGAWASGSYGNLAGSGGVYGQGSGVPAATGGSMPSQDPANKVATFGGGQSGYVSLPAIPANTFANGLTVEAWVDPANPPSGSTGQYARILDIGAGQNNAEFVLARDGTNNYYYSDGNGTRVENTTTTNYVVGQWQLVTLTWDTSGKETLYINGSAIASTTGTAPPSAVRNGYIGRSLWANDNTWAGGLGDVSIYGTALSSAQVAQHWADR